MDTQASDQPIVKSRWGMSRPHNNEGEEYLFELYNVDEGIHIKFRNLSVRPSSNLKFPYLISEEGTEILVNTVELKHIFEEYIRYFGNMEIL